MEKVQNVLAKYIYIYIYIILQGETPFFKAIVQMPDISYFTPV